MLKRKSVSFTSSHVSYVRQIEELVNSYFMVCGGFLDFCHQGQSGHILLTVNHYCHYCSSLFFAVVKAVLLNLRGLCRRSILPCLNGCQVKSEESLLADSFS